jgi:hypothetical protein
MSHEIVGFAGAVPTLKRLRARWRDGRIFNLARRSPVAFLPIPDMHSAESDDEEEGTGPGEFWSCEDFSPLRIGSFAGYSAGASLAWLKTDYFGSRGYQAAILWVDGAHILGPDVLWADDQAARPDSDWPINRALRSLGVARTRQHDEFAMFGLAGYRGYRDIVADAEETAIAGLTPPD